MEDNNEYLRRSLEFTAEQEENWLQKQFTYMAITSRMKQIADIGMLSIILLSPFAAVYEINSIKDNYKNYRIAEKKNLAEDSTNSLATAYNPIRH